MTNDEPRPNLERGRSNADGDDHGESGPRKRRSPYRLPRLSPHSCSSTATHADANYTRSIRYIIEWMHRASAHLPTSSASSWFAWQVKLSPLWLSILLAVVKPKPGFAAAMNMQVAGVTLPNTLLQNPGRGARGREHISACLCVLGAVGLAGGGWRGTEGTVRALTLSSHVRLSYVVGNRGDHRRKSCHSTRTKSINDWKRDHHPEQGSRP